MRGIDGPREILCYLDFKELDVIYTLCFLSIDTQRGVGVYDDLFGIFGIRD